MISIVAIIGKNGVIGSGGKVPWKVPEDMRRFRERTMGSTVVMGRKTFESIGKPLEGRDNVIITRNPDYHAEGCRVSHSVKDALAGEDIFVIGGGEIYAQTISLADKMYLTLVDDEPEGDVFFPGYEGFEEISREQHDGYCFVELRRSNSDT
ncbi:hypothetical protein BVX94_01735 [bacterium B17]|nr:hypothetical protein BVX94_01735 [bacterium B17]